MISEILVAWHVENSLSFDNLIGFRYHENSARWSSRLGYIMYFGSYLESTILATQGYVKKQRSHYDGGCWGLYGWSSIRGEAFRFEIWEDLTVPPGMSGQSGEYWNHRAHRIALFRGSSLLRSTARDVLTVLYRRTDVRLRFKHAVSVGEKILFVDTRFNIESRGEKHSPWWYVGFRKAW